MSHPRYLCIHGHFYQPPRENPWLEAIEIQDSAAPYHDWNERITRECYAPNSRARLVGNGKIIGLINNYAWISFNFGPTLLAWMAEAAPEVLHGIVEGDRLSRDRRHGHGNALAQVYNHIIMPLAEDKDKQTQVLWGIADFRKRFGRHPEGMWLAETAVDIATLEILAAAGVGFTILAPGQAKRWRRLGEENWIENSGGIDPSQAYLCRLPSGKSITLFFYDGNISQKVAFERLLDSGEKLLEHLLGGFDDARDHPQLMHMATDGESYGHHHAHGDMALAFALEKLRQNNDIQITNYGEFLELHPPTWEVEIRENTSWSCVHGVERWRSNCGCNMGRGWQQEWRAPLRQALDQLKKRLDQVFFQSGQRFFSDPWAARDGYIDVILDRGDESVQHFLQKYAHSNLQGTELRDALRLLEMQRHALLMFTSCGWFFDEISGLETTQCLRYAARAMQLAKYAGADLENDFLAQLEHAPSNLPEIGQGRVVWERFIRPSQVDLERVLAHYAISLIFHPPQRQAKVHIFDLDTLDQEVLERANSHVALARLHARSQLTRDEREASFVVLHYGGLDFHAVLRTGLPSEEYDDFKKKVLEAYRNGSLADITGLVDRYFQGQAYHLEDLFVEEQRRVISIVMQERFLDYQHSFERLANQDGDLLYRLSRLQFPIPRTMKSAAATALDQHLIQEIKALATEGNIPRIKDLCTGGKVWGYPLQERTAVRQTLVDQWWQLLQKITAESDLEAVTAHAEKLLDAAALLEFRPDLWTAQNRLLDAYAKLVEGQTMTPELHQTLVHLAERLNVEPSLLGWRP